MDKELEVRLQFLEEAQEYLDTLEAVVLGLSVTGVDSKKMDGALRAAHSIKGGAALMRFHLLSHTAHRLEDCFKILQARRPEVEEELENLLLNALDSIRQIIEMSREGTDPNEEAMLQPASPLFDQLQNILGEVQPEDETALASQESGHDLVKLFFESEVEYSLLRLEEVLSQPDQPCLESELSVLAQELDGLGEMLQLSNFSSLCLSVTHYLETYPAQVAQIATLALEKWRYAQALVLIGQRELIPSVLDYRPIAVPDTSDLDPAADNHQQSELELLLSGMDIAPIESLLSASEIQPGALPELALEHWPELESLFSDLQLEATTAKITDPSPAKTEADLGIEALLLGLDLDLFQELEAAPPVQPLAEVILDNEWADLDSLFAELERETPTLQRNAESPQVAADAKTDAKEQGIEPGQERTPEIGEMDLLANLFDFEAEPLVLEEEQIKAEPAPLAIFDPEEITSDLSEDMGLGMLAALLDIGMESALSKQITLTEAEIHSEVEAPFLEVFDIEAAAPVVSPEVLEISPEPEIMEALVAETALVPENQEIFTLETEQPIVLAEVSEISLEPLALEAAVEQEIIETPITAEILEAEQPADEPSSEWSEIAAFVKVSAVAATVTDAIGTAVDQEHPTEAEHIPDKNEALLELQQVQEETALEHEFPQELVAEAVRTLPTTEEGYLALIRSWREEAQTVEPIAPVFPQELVAEAVTTPENQEVFTLETEQPIVLAEVFEISLEPQIPQEIVAETVLNSEPPSDILEKSILPKKIETASSNSEANTVRIPAKRLDQLDDLCGDLTIERNGLALYLARLHNLVTSLNARVRNLEQFNLRLRSAYDQEANQANTPMLGEQPSTSEENFDALEMDRYSELHLVWQEVMESIVQIQEVTSDIDLTVRSADDTAAELNRTAKQLQSNVMYSRMRPLTDVVGRFPRAIRDLAQQFGKPAALKIQGGSTLIDRTVLGILGDPLMHLLRNAFDHGLEDIKTRLARGKTAQGTIEIKAFYRGNETIITVSDDGGGINLDKIRDKAQLMGFDQAQLEKALPQDLLDLIFEPGFSTADQVTELSGRGVGMDVVRTNIQQVRGKITVNTQPGIGTTFTLSVPVTLSVGRVLLVESQNVMLAFPVDAIEQMALLEEEDNNDSTIFQWENYAVPKLALKEWLNYRCPIRKVETDDIAMMANPAMLILSQGSDLVGVPIERCWGEREVAIRQAEGPIPMPPGFSGCTILGTGQVVPLVSIPGLFAWIANQEHAPKTAVPVQSAAGQVQQERESILVIDDSINVRLFLAMTLEKAGYRVAQAKDGQDAIEQLTSGLVVNAVICDIEMPRLDGFGFLAEAKANPALKHLPITMLTSRSGDKHRQLALRLGASEYFSKPFKEQELLQALNQLIQSTHRTPTA